MTAAAHADVPLRRAGLRAMAALSGREMRRVLSLWTQTVLPAVTTGVIFLAIFGGALGDRLQPAPDVDYLAFILPGLLVMTVVGQVFANNSTSLFQAKNEGYIEDVLSSPIRPWQMVVAYMSGGLLRAWLAALTLALVAAPFAGAPEDPVLLIIALVLAGLVFAPLGVITGMWADTFDQHAFIANLIVTPLALLAGVFYSPARLEQPWETLTRADPLFYLVDATREGYIGSHESPLWISLVVSALVAAALTVAAVRLLHRGWRLKP